MLLLYATAKTWRGGCSASYWGPSAGGPWKRRLKTPSRPSKPGTTRLNVWTQVIPASQPEQWDSGRNQSEMAVTNIKPKEIDMITVQVSKAATGTSSGQLYLDDLHVGQRFTSGAHRLDEAQIKAFAIQFDPQPFHTDKQAAEPKFFKGLAASGWHTAAITMRLNVESGPPLAGGFVGAGGELSWPAPTRPGDVLHVKSEVV